MSTGFPDADARSGFDRERRRRALANIVARLRSEPDDVSEMLPFEEVVGALGRRSERDLGVQVIPLESIVGTVDRSKRRLRPQVPARHAGGARALGADRDRAAPRRRDAADRRLPGRRPALRQGRPPPRVRRPRARRHRHRGARARGRHRGRRRAASCARASSRSSSHERVFHERVPLPPDGARADQARRRVEVRPARQPDRGLGLPREPSPRPPDGPPRDGRDLVPRGVRAGHPLPRGGGHRRRRDRDRALPADRDDPLPAAAHPRLDRRGDRAAARRPAPGRPRATTRWSTRSSRRWSERRPVVAQRRRLPDLPAQLRGRRRRRRRRPARDHGAARPPRRAGRRRALALPRLPLAAGRRGYDIADYQDIDPRSGRSTTSTRCSRASTRAG